MKRHCLIPAAALLVALVQGSACLGQQPKLVLQSQGGPVYCVTFSPDAHMVAAGEEDGRIEVWEVISGGRLATLRGHTKAVVAVAFTGDGKFLESSSKDGTTRVWSLANGVAKAVRKEHADGAFPWARTEAHELVAAGSANGTVWLLGPRRQKVGLQGHTDFVPAVAFSSDDRLLASGSWDATVMVWDVAAIQGVWLKQEGPDLNQPPQDLPPPHRRRESIVRGAIPRGVHAILKATK
jgi:WD40 repeat protein